MNEHSLLSMLLLLFFHIGVQSCVVFLQSSAALTPHSVQQLTVLVLKDYVELPIQAYLKYRIVCSVNSAS